MKFKKYRILLLVVLGIALMWYCYFVFSIIRINIPDNKGLMIVAALFPLAVIIISYLRGCVYQKIVNLPTSKEN